MNIFDQIASYIGSLFSSSKKQDTSYFASDYLAELAKEDFKTKNLLEEIGLKDLEFDGEEELIITHESLKKMNRKDLVEICDILLIKVLARDNKKILINKISKEVKLREKSHD